MPPRRCQRPGEHISAGLLWGRVRYGARWGGGPEGAFFYRLCPTTIREEANGHVDMCRPVVRGPASTYLMKCCGVSVMVPGGEVARQRAPLLTGSVPPPHHMAGGARREERGHKAGVVGRTSTHHLLALGCIRCLCVCCLAEHLLSRAVAWQSCRAHPAPPRQVTRAQGA